VVRSGPDRSQLRTPEQAAALIRPDDVLALPLGPGVPGALLHALGARTDFEGLRVFSGLLLEPYALFTHAGVLLLSGFLGPVERGLHAAGADVEFIPSDFRGFARVARRLRPRVVATAVAPADAHGRYSLSLHAGATVDEIHRCGADPTRLLIAEVNAQLPRTYGLPPDHAHALDRAEIDVLIETDRPPPSIDDPPAGPLEQAIANHAQAYIPDGATLQTGIGGIPGEIAEILATGSGGDYGVHSEMFTTGLMRLHQAGKVTNRKGAFDGSSITTFALGTPELYAWLHEREDVRFLPVSVVNDPSLIGRNRRMVSINGALAVDLFGQLAADALSGRQYSGIGGHEDFVAGAGAAPGGHSLVCLPSTARVDEAPVSRITAALPPGSLVTTPRHHVDVVITEYGAAELSGRTVGERARALIDVAHPDFRERLQQDAAKLGLLAR
jgi:acyl-CoA hydrolase